MCFCLTGREAKRIEVLGWVARNGAPAERVEAFFASTRGVERARTQPGTSMSKAGRPDWRIKLTHYQTV